MSQVKMLVHSMNTGSLQSMVPKIIHEAETYFKEKWQVTTILLLLLL